MIYFKRTLLLVLVLDIIHDCEYVTWPRAQSSMATWLHLRTHHSVHGIENGEVGLLRDEDHLSRQSRVKHFRGKV